jgi:SAM-dependent methyltransferase
MSPPCQTHISADQLNSMERFYPLHAYVCGHCFLVQLGEFVTPDEIFSEYAYFSSYSETWLKHCETYTATMIERFGLDSGSRVIEVASNDGYLLQYFTKRGVPALGIEPAANVAKAAVEKGIPTIVAFLGEATGRRIAAEKGQADLLAGNNVLAHVPDLNDFVAGLRSLLGPAGVLTMEFPHLLELVDQNQFDTIYHEHFSYFSFTTVEKVFAAHGITLFDVDRLPTHGGSLRIYGRHSADLSKPVTANVQALKAEEEAWGLSRIESYAQYGEKVKRAKRGILDFLINAKEEGKTIVGYGAPGKGNTLLNYCGIRTDFLDFTVDRNPYKQGKYTPGAHIPILHPDAIGAAKPDYLFILPWNLKDEIMEKNAFIRQWGGRFVVPIPEIRIYA